MNTSQLTFTRFLAATAIVIFHFGKEVFPFSSASVHFLFQQASVGVSYFFILSGFVMIIAYRNKEKISLIEFLKNRVARIYPLYFLALCLLLLFLYRYMPDAPFDRKGFLLNLFMIQAWVPGKALSFNSPGWSLAVEFCFYVSFPFLYNYFYRVCTKNKILIFIFSFWLINQLILHLYVQSSFYDPHAVKREEFLYYFPLMHLNEFLIGNLAGILFTGKTKNYDFGILGCTAVFVLLLKYPMNLFFHNGLLAVVFVPIIYILASNTGIITSIFRTKFAVLLGEISYGIYILQAPVFLLMQKVFKHYNISEPVRCFYVYFTVLLAVSTISYYLIEKPLREKIKKIRLVPRKQRTAIL